MFIFVYVILGNKIIEHFLVRGVTGGLGVVPSCTRAVRGLYAVVRGRFAGCTRAVRGLYAVVRGRFAGCTRLYAGGSRVWFFPEAHRIRQIGQSIENCFKNTLFDSVSSESSIFWSDRPLCLPICANLSQASMIQTIRPPSLSGP